MNERLLGSYDKILWVLFLLGVLKATVDIVTRRLRQGRSDGRPRNDHSGRLAGSTPAHPYRLRDDFLSPAEASFYHVLAHVSADWAVVLAKVNLGDLLYAPRAAGRAQWLMWNRINRKHLDYVLCDRQTLRPLLAVELDDSSHQQARRVERDRFVDGALAQAGLELVRVPAQRTYAAAELGERLWRASRLWSTTAPAAASGSVATGPIGGAMESTAPTLGGGEAPPCPRCGATMVLRRAARGRYAGQPFWGCENYPRCRGRRDV